MTQRSLCPVCWDNDHPFEAFPADAVAVPCDAFCSSQHDWREMEDAGESVDEIERHLLEVHGRQIHEDDLRFMREQERRST